MAEHNFIEIRGAREHNLKNIDISIPKNRLTVITGLSGSGKSSLAFDTVYAEGQRRYVESLSSYARQFLELMKKLQKQNHMGIIFITHNLGVVAEVCDKVSVMYAGKMVEQGPVDDIFYNPGHPYTKGLLRSMPRVDAESYERLIPIEGSPVDMLNPPEGCPFAPRCEHAMKICLQKMPPYVEMGENHHAACWLRVQDCLAEAKKGNTETANIEKTEVDSHE